MSKKRIITVDQLGNEFLHFVKSGQWIEVFENGKVVVS